MWEYVFGTASQSRFCDSRSRLARRALRGVVVVALVWLLPFSTAAHAERHASAGEIVHQTARPGGAPSGTPAPAASAHPAPVPRGAIVPGHAGALPERGPSGTVSWLDRINGVRADAGLAPLVEEPEWSVGSALHSRYMVKNNYVGHDEDLSNPWYTPEGLAAGRHGNAYANYNVEETGQHGIDAWLTTPFHLINVLDPRLTRTGFGWYRERQEDGYQIGATLDVARGIDLDREPGPYPIVFPGNGTRMPFSRYFGTEYPDPLTSCPDRAFQGAPIMVQLASVPQVTAVTLMKDGLYLDRCVFDETTYVNPEPEAQAVGREVLARRHAVTIMPREPLTAGVYRVTLVDGESTHTWAFAGPWTAGVPTTARQEAAVLPFAVPSPAATPVRAAACPSQQEAGVGVVRRGTDRLLTIVAARGTNTVLRQLHFGPAGQPLENVEIELNGYPAPITRRGTVTLPPDTRQITFAVQRVESGRAMRAPFTVSDSCGDWSTAVEAGPTTP